MMSSEQVVASLKQGKAHGSLSLSLACKPGKIRGLLIESLSACTLGLYLQSSAREHPD